MTPRSMATPKPPATRKAVGSATRQRIVEGAGKAGPEYLLHHEGRVGPDHHHLAMGHVYDAHDAERDGESDRRQQEHRAEADPGEELAQQLPEEDPFLDVVEHRARGVPHPGRPFPRQRVRFRRGGDAGIGIIGQAVESRDADIRLPGVQQPDGGQRARQRVPGAVVGLAPERVFERLQLARLRRLEYGRGGGNPPLGILAGQRQPAESRADGAPQPVVAAQSLQRALLEIPERFAGQGIGHGRIRPPRGGRSRSFRPTCEDRGGAPAWRQGCRPPVRRRWPPGGSPP